MNRVYVNIGIGIFWLFAAGLLFLTGKLEPSTLAVFIILAMLFFWSAFKLYTNPHMATKKRQSIVQQLSDPNYKNSTIKKKK